MLTSDRWTLLDIEALDDEVDALHGHIISCLGQISQTRLTQESIQERIDLMEAINDLEAIGDLIEANLVGLGMTGLEAGLTARAKTRTVLTELHGAVAESLDLAMMALTQKNADPARRVGNMKKQINSMERSAAAHEATRLVAEAPDRIAHYRFEIDVIAALKRIFYFAKRIARVSVPEAEKARMTEG